MDEKQLKAYPTHIAKMVVNSIVKNQIYFTRKKMNFSFTTAQTYLLLQVFRSPPPALSFPIVSVNSIRFNHRTLLLKLENLLANFAPLIWKTENNMFALKQSRRHERYEIWSISWLGSLSILFIYLFAAIYIFAPACYYIESYLKKSSY